MIKNKVYNVYDVNSEMFVGTTKIKDPISGQLFKHKRGVDNFPHGTIYSECLWQIEYVTKDNIMYCTVVNVKNLLLDLKKENKENKEE